jgi:hypothetical protein
MPRPNPPPPRLRPTLSPFSLGERETRDLAKVLGLTNLSPLVADAIAHVIACYKATEAGSPDATVGNILAEPDYHALIASAGVCRSSGPVLPTRGSLHDLLKTAR